MYSIFHAIMHPYYPTLFTFLWQTSLQQTPVLAELLRIFFLHQTGFIFVVQLLVP